ncbi:MAG: hypothetical protein MJY67_00530 [Bacteroidales bacterium]|nr:hypothetical protein [Bacteroidales bacterium]
MRNDLIKDMIRRSLFVMASASVLLVQSCGLDDPNADRDEFIKVFTSLNAEEEAAANPAITGDGSVDQLCVGTQAGEYKIFVKTNSQLSAVWQDGESSPWASVVSYEKSSKADYYEVTLRVKVRSNEYYYSRRTGTLMLIDPSKNLGKYVRVHQGATARLSQTFDWLKYGSVDPQLEDETPFEKWTATQKGYNYTTSTPAYCGGKNGYVKLGDNDGHGADFVTPFVDNFRLDSLIMVTFKAVAYVAPDGTKDVNKLKIEVVGGGVIAEDASTSTTITVPYFDPESENYPTDMFADGAYVLFVKSVKGNEISSNTRIRFIAGDTSAQAPVNNRIMLDYIYIRTINPKIDQPYYEQNGGSGPDKIRYFGQEEEETL